MKVLTTPRLRLAEVSLDMAERLTAGAGPAGEDWADEYPLEGTVIAATMLLAGAEAGTYQDGFGIYQIVERASGLVIGDIGFHGPPGASGAVEVGYGIVPSRRGAGLMSESLRALAAWALGQPGVLAIEAGTAPDNLPSQRVLSRCGFRRIGLANGEVRFVLTGADRESR